MPNQLPNRGYKLTDQTGEIETYWYDYFYRQSTGVSVTIITAALSGAGTQGTMTFVNGILTAQTQAT